MTGIPDDAIRVRLAVDVPCQQGRDAMSCANWYGNDVGCHDCHRDLTCTVVTDVEVERQIDAGGRWWGSHASRGHIPDPHSPDADGRETVCSTCWPLWREVQP